MRYVRNGQWVRGGESAQTATAEMGCRPTGVRQLGVQWQNKVRNAVTQNGTRNGMGQMERRVVPKYNSNKLSLMFNKWSTGEGTAWGGGLARWGYNR